MFRVSKLAGHAKVPTRANTEDAGLDLSASEAATVPARGMAVVGTGIAIAFPSDCYARIAPRSGLAAKQAIDTGAGVIDSTYRGEIKVILFNHSDTDFDVSIGDRIAQLIFERIYTPNLELVGLDALGESSRGANGFGSSGI